MNKNAKVGGLKQRLVAAKSAKEVESLMNEGAKYTEASDKTRRQWIRIAKRLQEVLNAEEGKKPAKTKAVKSSK